MSHHHHHDHTDTEPDFKTKLSMLFDHWLSHNEDHIESYLQWGTKAQDQGFTETAELMNEIAEASRAISEKIKKAAASVK